MFTQLQQALARRSHPARPAPSTDSATTSSGLPRFLQESTPDAGVSASTTPDAGVSDAATPNSGVADAGPAPTDAGVPLPGGVAEAEPAPPTGPDACSTVEEEQRKNQFRLRSFSALNFRSSLGYGQFDAYYWPSLSLMSAIVKMKFNYVQADTTPPPMTLFAMLMAGQDISRFFWTDAEKRQFAADYVQRVGSRWSFAHTFRSTKPCWPFLAHPYIAPRVVDDSADAHFDVTVHKSPGPGIDYSSGFQAQNPGTPGWRGTGDLYSTDVREEPDFNSVHVARSERRRLERAIAAANASPILFQTNSSTVEPVYRSRLQAVADAMKSKNPSDPGIPMVFNGFASADGDATRNQQLSQERAEAAAQVLRDAGVPQPLVITPNGPVGAPGDAANRKVEVAPSTTFETTYSTNRYSVAEHEFGHALGLPDEYVNRTTGPLGAKQTAFVNLARAAGVDPPDQWGDRTASQMSAGVDVLARHYLTVWEALGQMTSPDIMRDEWNID